MNDETISIEEKIIYAAIDCINEYGITGATSRRIARSAGVNIAAINYYFRSKDALIQRCMEITIKNAFDLRDMPSMPGVSAEERCISIMVSLIEGGLRYPGITRAHFYPMLVEGRLDKTLMEQLDCFIQDLTEDLKQRGSPLPFDELKLALIQIVTGIFMVILAPALFERQPMIDFQDQDSCLPYVTRLVNRLLS